MVDLRIIGIPDVLKFVSLRLKTQAEIMSYVHIGYFAVQLVDSQAEENRANQASMV